ncbi:MFS transporter [Streptomyces sp. NPDC053728]|uniref:MFS transporter n=1 Tax=Streptomyces sp. NPDC053728 TaxID=3155534 RepID=UPI00342BC025
MTALEPRDAEVAAALVETTVAEPAEGVLGRTYRALSIGIVSVVLLIAFEATAVGTAMPVAAKELHGIPLYAFAFSAYFTTSLFAMVLSGQWADRRGPLAPLATGIGAFGAGLLLSGTAGGMWMFILGRAVQGVGGGLLIVGCFGMGIVIASTSVLLLKLSSPQDAGANSAALQISDGLSNALLLAAGGAAFAALGGGGVGAAHGAAEDGAALLALTARRGHSQAADCPTALV